jgi:hypothetical protein
VRLGPNTNANGSRRFRGADLLKTFGRHRVEIWGVGYPQNYGPAISGKIRVSTCFIQNYTYYCLGLQPSVWATTSAWLRM